MTILNATTTSDGKRAVIAADTIVGMGEETRSAIGSMEVPLGQYTSKVLVLPHMHTVIAARGHNIVMAQAFYALLLLGVEDVDAGDEYCGQLFHGLLNRYLEETLKAAAKAPEYDTRSQTVLVGYSRKHQSLRMFGYDTTENAWGKAFPPGRSICAPDNDDPEILAKAESMANGNPTTEDACELALLQYRMMEREEPELLVNPGGFGGHLTVAEIDCDEIRVRLVRDALPTPEPRERMRSRSTTVAGGRHRTPKRG